MQNKQNDFFKYRSRKIIMEILNFKEKSESHELEGNCKAESTEQNTSWFTQKISYRKTLVYGFRYHAHPRHIRSTIEKMPWRTKYTHVLGEK